MPTPFESAQLNLRLFDMRREPVLREASGEPEFCKHIEAVVLAASDAEAILARRREAARIAARAHPRGHRTRRPSGRLQRTRGRAFDLLLSYVAAARLSGLPPAPCR